MLVLGVESSCDDTAAALVEGTPGQPLGTIRANVVRGQARLHETFGGVVPEIAARAHVDRLDHVVEAALDAANVTLNEVDALAVTAGPGLIGGVMAGVMFAKGLAAGRRLPVWGINHLAGHALTPRLVCVLPFPYLMLLVSGGHCQFLVAHGPTAFRRVGSTIDDAVGEAFDKVAKLLGLPQPGGPAIETLAAQGDPARYGFPRPLLDRDGCDMSFSGLKTAVRRVRDLLVAEQGGLHQTDIANIAAGFQQAVADVLQEKARRALRSCSGNISAIAVAGGVAANREVRQALAAAAADAGIAFVAPPPVLCTDNAAMIAWAAIEKMAVGQADALDFSPRPRWPLDAEAEPVLGGGRKGAKA